QRHELPGPLRHFHRLAATQQAHELTDLDVESGRAATHRLDRGAQALDVTGMIRAKHNDHVGKAASKLFPVISYVGCDVGRAAIRLEDRTIHVIAELRGAEEQKFARLPIFHHLALGRRQRAPIEQPLLLKECYRLGNLAWSSILRLMQRTLGKEDLMLDPER